jgi:hypothetical protein
MSTLSKEFPMSGIWLTPSNPDKKIRGTVEFYKSDKIILKLCCLSEDDFHLFKDTSTIQGVNVNGKKITLLDCFVSRTQKKAVSGNNKEEINEKTQFVWNIEIFVNYILVGAYVSDSQDELFKSVELQSPVINNWLCRYYNHHKKRVLGDDPCGLFYQASFCNNGLTLSASALEEGEVGFLSESKEIYFRVRIARKSGGQISIKGAFEIGFPFLGLIPLLCDCHHACQMFELECEEGHAQLYFNDFHSPKESLSHVSSMLSLADLTDYFPRMLSRWYADHSDYVRASKLYKHTLSTSCSSYADLIASYVRILEALLGQKFHQAGAEDTIFIEEARLALEKIKNKAYKRNYLCSLKWGHRMYPEEIMLEYCKDLLGKEENYKYIRCIISMGIKIRNDETHLKTFIPVTDKEFLQRQLAEVVFYSLIKTKLLENLGVTREYCLQLFNTHEHFRSRKNNIKELVNELKQL